MAWIYKAGGEGVNIQANPIIAEGKAFFPAAGEFIVGVDAATGREIWRHKSQANPAKRGLTWWAGTSELEPRIYFPAGEHLYAISAKTGKLIDTFGEKGAAGTGRSFVAPPIAKGVVLYATMSKAAVEGTSCGIYYFCSFARKIRNQGCPFAKFCNFLSQHSGLEFCCLFLGLRSIKALFLAGGPEGGGQRTRLSRVCVPNSYVSGH